MIGILPFALADATGGEGDGRALPLGVFLLIGQFLQGFGLAAVALPLMTLALSSLNSDEAPWGNAEFSIIKQVGASLGVAVIAVILQHFLTNATTPQQAPSAFNDTFWWILGLSTIPLLLIFLTPATKSADQKASPSS